MDHPNAALITPLDLATRQDPTTGKISTIDLTFTSSSLSLNAKISVKQSLDRGHFPVTINLNAAPTRSPSRPSTWILDEKKWGVWNSDLAKSLQDSNINYITDPELFFRIYERQEFLIRSPLQKVTHLNQIKTGARPPVVES